MGYNHSLVKQSVEIGARYKYLCQGEDPWCQTYTARWLRWKAKGKDIITRGTEPEVSNTQNLGVLRVAKLGQGRGYNMEASADMGDGVQKAPVSVVKAKFKADFYDKIEKLRKAFYTGLGTADQKQNKDTIRQYIQFGVGPILKGRPRNTDKQILKFCDNKNIVKTEGWKSKLQKYFLQPNSYFWILRVDEGAKGHAMAAHYNGASFFFFEPCGGELEMNAATLQEWTHLPSVEPTIFGTGTFVTLERFEKSNTASASPESKAPQEKLDIAAIDAVDRVLDADPQSEAFKLLGDNDIPEEFRSSTSH
jgi:hypothetical protein